MQLVNDIRRSGGLTGVDETEPDDLFIACASFEPRCLSACSLLGTSYRTHRSLIYANREFIDSEKGAKARSNLYGMVGHLARHSTSEVEVVEGSWLSNIEQIRALRSGLKLDCESLSPPSRIFLDCTTFNRESLLTLMFLIRTSWRGCRIKLVYTSPVKHGEWLSRGFRSVRNVIGFGGTRYPGRPTALVVLSGFECHRTQRVIEEHEPGVVILGVGDPPTAPEFLRRNTLEHSLVLNRQDVKQFAFDAGNVDKCVKQLTEQIVEFEKTHNVVFAPMSTKLSTIASYLVAETKPDIQITYCLPGEYNLFDYSEGIRSVFSFELTKQD